MKKRNVISFAISLILLLVLFSRVDLSQISRILAGANPLYLVGGAICALTVLGLRLARWQVFLEAYKLKNIKRIDIVSSYLASQFLANLTPARVGEVSRAYFMKRRHKTSFFYIVPAVLIERFIDTAVLLLTALVFFAFFSFFVSTTLQLMLLIVSFILLAFLVVILNKRLATWSFKQFFAVFSFIPLVKKVRPELQKKMENFYKGLVALKSMKTFQIFILTCMCYVFEGAILYLTALSLPGPYLPYTFAVGFMALAWIGGALSTLPGGIGSMEAVLFALLMLIGFAAPLALSIAILYRFVSFVLAVSFCSIFFFREAR
jgi:hypothetical protein